MRGSYPQFVGVISSSVPLAVEIRNVSHKLEAFIDQSSVLLCTSSIIVPRRHVLFIYLFIRHLCFIALREIAHRDFCVFFWSFVFVFLVSFLSAILFFTDFYCCFNVGFQKCSNPAVSGDCIVAVNRTGVHFLSQNTMVSEKLVVM